MTKFDCSSNELTKTYGNLSNKQQRRQWTFSMIAALFAAAMNIDMRNRCPSTELMSGPLSADVPGGLKSLTPGWQRYISDMRVNDVDEA